MNNSELNSKIEHYVKKDQTRTAVLLTGEWGSGKSFYINNSLKPYLDARRIKCIVISLYSVTSLEDLSKQIYLKMRLSKLYKESEKIGIVLIAAANLINNCLAHKEIKLSVSDSQLKKLYKSINLNNTLLVLEDMERSSIDVISLLGYINGMVEYSNAKVLLVANEDEIIKKQNETIGKKNVELANHSEDENDNNKPFVESDYCKMKEKTIGDTLRFKTDTNVTVRNILASFSGACVKALSEAEEVKNISDIITARCKNNFRVLLYALQKYVDIFEMLKAPKDSFTDSFYYATFEGLLIVSNDFLKSNIPDWEGTYSISPDLGSKTSPVFRFVYTYLLDNSLDADDVVKTAGAYKEYLYLENVVRKEDEDIQILNNYLDMKEVDVLNALKNIENKLQRPDFVSLSICDKIAYFVIKVGELLEYDYERILELLIENAKKMCAGQQVDSHKYIWADWKGSDDSDKVKKEYDRFVNELTSAIDSSYSKYEFSYKPDELSEWYDSILTDRKKYCEQHRFISWYDVTKLYEMLLVCSSKQMGTFRGILFVYYRNASKGDYDTSDKMALMKLNELLEQRNIDNKWDRIQKKQIEYLKSNLKEFIDNM